MTPEETPWNRKLTIEEIERKQEQLQPPLYDFVIDREKIKGHEQALLREIDDIIKKVTEAAKIDAELYLICEMAKAWIREQEEKPHLYFIEYRKNGSKAEMAIIAPSVDEASRAFMTFKGPKAQITKIRKQEENT